MTELEHLKVIRTLEKQLLKDEIVDKVERMIKDNDQPSLKGMTEIGTHWIILLEDLLVRLQAKEHNIMDIIQQIQNQTK